MHNLRLISEENYIEEFGVEPEWTGVDYDDNVHIFLDDKNNIVGDCVLFIYPNGYTTIDNFEMRYQSQGYGRTCVNILKEKFNKLYGESVLEAIEFWIKMGAYFKGDDFDKIDPNSEYPQLIPFTIN